MIKYPEEIKADETSKRLDLIKKWKKMYIKKMVMGGLTIEEAEMSYEAGIGDHDFDDDPEISATDELGYWVD